MARVDRIIAVPPGGKDDLPDYPDRGCELAPRCLECPLPLCRFDTVNQGLVKVG